jgi:hypothetical protein
MKIKNTLSAASLALVTSFALAGWYAPAFASPLEALSGNSHSQAGYQVAEDEHERERGDDHDKSRHQRDDEWYQGQRGHWDRDHDNWQWRGAEGDEWYMGQRGHWYDQGNNGWQFGSDGLVCNNGGRNCRRGGYVPGNGEGMVSRTNPNLFWHCNSEGHKCSWTRRPSSY